MKNSISIYGLFKIVNILFLILMIYTHAVVGDNIYINGWSVCLGAVLTVISHSVLTDAQKNRNHLLAILAYILILHYELRIITLNYTEYSYVFNKRINIDIQGINYVLIYCILCYILCWLSFHYSKKSASSKVSKNEELKPRAARNVLIVLYASFFLQTMSDIGVPGISQLVSIASTFFFNASFILMFGIGYFIYVWKSVPSRYKLLFVVFVILHIVVHTLGGSRSAAYTIIILSFICFLAYDMVKVKTKYLIYAVVAVPLMAVMFLYATFTRSLGEKATSVSEVVEIGSTLSDKNDGLEMSIILAPVFDRIAFFDFTAEMVHNRDYLSNYIKPAYYLESVVDNLLTPGFNIFDMPRMSYVVDKCYIFKGRPSINGYNLNDEDFYHSDCFTWFGEAYLLFGKICALPVILLVGLFIRKTYLKNLRQQSLSSSWKRIIILYVTYTLLYSYGLDWLFIDIFGLVINYYIFKSVTIQREKKHKLIDQN